MAHRAQGSTYVNQFIKVVTKDTDEQPEEEIHRVRSARVLSAGTSVPTGVTLLVCGCVRQSGSSLNPTLLGFHTGFLSKA